MDSSSDQNPAHSSTSGHMQIDQATEMAQEEAKEVEKTEPIRVSTGSNTSPVEPQNKRESNVNIFLQTSLSDADKINIIVLNEPLSREDKYSLSQCNNVKLIDVNASKEKRYEEENTGLSPLSMEGLQMNWEPHVELAPEADSSVEDDDDTFNMVEKTVTVLVHDEKNQHQQVPVKGENSCRKHLGKEENTTSTFSTEGKTVKQQELNVNDMKKVQPFVPHNKENQHAISTTQNQKASLNQIQIQSQKGQNENSTNLKNMDKKGSIFSVLTNKNNFSRNKSTRETFWRKNNSSSIPMDRSNNNKNKNNNNNNSSFNSIKNSNVNNKIKAPEPIKSKPVHNNNNNNSNKTTAKTNANTNNNTNANNPKAQSITNKDNINSNNTTHLNRGNNSNHNNKMVSKTLSKSKTNIQKSNNSTMNISLKSSSNSIPVSRTGSIMSGTAKKPPNYFFSENQIDSKTGLLKPTESLRNALSSVTKLESYQKFEISSRAGSKFKFAGIGQKSITRPKEIIHNHIVTKGTYSKTRWSCGFETLTIKQCLYYIFPQNLLNSRDVLTTLKFSSLTSFKNVVQVLRCCPNLIRLAFSNLSLVHKKPVLPPDSDSVVDEDYLIELPYLRELQFVEWISGLTKSEYWLLDFFFRAVTFGRLESFTFAGNENFMSDKDIKAAHKKLRDGNNTGNSTSSKSSSSSASPWKTAPYSYSTSWINLSIVWKFLQKNKSIEWLSLGGVGFYLIDPEKLNSGNIGDIGDGGCLQLTSLRITLNAPGIEHLLRSQKRLTTLSCSGFLNIFDNKLKTAVTDCIQNNWTTLDAIRISPCIITDEVTDSGEERGDLYSINCECFQKCTRLQSLFLNATAATQKFTKRMSCGSVLNIHLLPTTLVQIEIYNEEFHQDELEQLLGQKLLNFVHLKHLVLSSNSANLYLVHLHWIQNLSEITSFKTADFFGGMLEDPQALNNFLEKLKNDKSIDILMTLCADCVCFSKFDDVITTNNSKSNVQNQSQNVTSEIK